MTFYFLYINKASNLRGPVCFFTPPLIQRRPCFPKSGIISYGFCGSSQQKFLSFSSENFCYGSSWSDASQALLDSRTSWVSPLTDTQAWNTFKGRPGGAAVTVAVKNQQFTPRHIDSHTFSQEQPVKLCCCLLFRSHCAVGVVPRLPHPLPPCLSPGCIPAQFCWSDCLQQKITWEM